MPWLDLGILAIVLISTIISALRGFTKDAISLSAWVLAFVIAIGLSDRLALILPQAIENPKLRLGIAVSILFIATLMMGYLANFLLAGVIDLLRMRSLDKSLGVLFGLLRGLVIICLLLILGAFIGLNETAWWHRSSLVPLIQVLLEMLAPLFPDNFAQYMNI